ncbi:hypothetical protein [Vibrio cholerae]|uniref:hypothetical protein n=1 Tax=Vibrio cholerae TaxID=666 RepID=UPI0011F28CA1|nr:hypothetical protein [Vibrio cholerae]KAA1205860.1 hypothetical protein F0M20_05010 [Vibrio cholerae]
MTEETKVAFELLRSAPSNDKAPARIEVATCNGVDLILNECPLSVGSRVTAEFRYGKSNSERFYLSYKELLSSQSIKSGLVPSCFYVVDKNYFFNINGEVDNQDIFNKIKIICDLISGLKKLAHYEDASKNKLVFLASDENKSHVMLDIYLPETVLDADLTDISVLTSLLPDEAKLDAHFESQKSIFYSSLAEFLSGLEPDKAFCKLVEKWGEFTAVYQRNFSTYLSGFAFHKAKKEVAESEIKIAEQLSKVTSELIGKLFSIPVSIAAIVAMFHKDSSLITDGLIVLGLLLAAVLVVGMVINQKNQLGSVKQAKIIVEQAIEGKKSSYPQELKEHIENMSTRLDENIRTARNWLFAFRILAWIPALVGTAVFYFKYSYGALIANAVNLLRHMI